MYTRFRVKLELRLYFVFYVSCCFLSCILLVCFCLGAQRGVGDPSVVAVTPERALQL